ncbi:LOW QUALITY PROTEIN: hypothetical protein TorRG33x02_040700 [Trema orientale]|uniref:Transmembrane protein n=1 Tax=Trema orientale TaxID=63057 RepID=A0A2P5FR91_TREOI|nr:LOW QUALITY PROTEIN: hypothetical protein TorRG33x02_040700 [Trema orientale]
MHRLIHYWAPLTRPASYMWPKSGVRYERGIELSKGEKKRHRPITHGSGLIYGIHSGLDLRTRANAAIPLLWLMLKLTGEKLTTHTSLVLIFLVFLVLSLFSYNYLPKKKGLILLLMSNIIIFLSNVFFF